MSPYKDKEAKRRHDRDYIQKKRTTNNRDDIVGTTRPRYLSDGQVLDRAKVPMANKALKGMAQANKADARVVNQEKADRYKRWKEGRADIEPALYAVTEDRTRLEKIVASLKRHNVLRNSYWGCGVHSLPMDLVGEMLEVTQCH